MSGSSGSTQQNQTSTVQLPPWVSAAAQQNYGFAQDVAQRPLQQFNGQQVADVAPSTIASWNLAGSSPNAGAGAYDAATAGYVGSLGKGVPTVTPGMLSKTDLQPYMDPYVKNVVDTSMQRLEAQRQQSIMGNADTATRASAYGGSRQAITDAVTNSQSALGAGQLSSQLYDQAYKDATGNATNDLNRQLSAATSNQGAALTKGSQDLTAASGLETLGNDAQRNILQQFGMLSAAGSDQQSQAQKVIDANKAKFQQAFDYPTDQLNTLLASLGMTPYGKTQTTQGETTQTYEPDIAQSILGGLSIAGGLFKSDERTKKDIAKIGRDPASGLNAYSFRYKDAPKGSPKVVGPMAQEVEKKYPSAVTSIGGVKFVKPAHLPASGMGVLGMRPKKAGGVLGR